MGLLNTLRFILGHPLNNGHKTAALWRFGAWQIRSRIAGSPLEVSFVDDTKLRLSPGQTGATGNLYAGLHEFEEMSFVLHFLRPDDMFVDVGANVGSYTVLAGGAVGATCVAFEPAPRAFDALQRNVTINGFTSRAQLIQAAVGSMQGKVSFTSGRDTLNHVDLDAAEADSIDVDMTTLDTALNGLAPTLMKIDVEGFEAQVLAGGAATLKNSGLLAVIVETNGSGVRYSTSDSDLHDVMAAAGFSACTYEPFSRRLTPTGKPKAGANTLYVRYPDDAQTRVKSARRFRIAGRQDL